MASAYLTRAEADLRLGAYGATAWAAASTANRDAALARASAFLDRRYAGRWKGQRAVAGQMLAWPRLGASDGDGYAIEDDAIPEMVRAATAEAALALVQGAELESRPGMAPEIKRISKAVGPVRKDVEYVTGSAPGGVVRFEALDGMLAGLLLPPRSSSQFLMRA